jgi:hypothetical protein
MVTAGEESHTEVGETLGTEHLGALSQIMERDLLGATVSIFENDVNQNQGTK